MRRIWLLCWAVGGTLAVLLPVAELLLSGLQTTDADIGPNGARTQVDYYVARNTVLGEAIRVCSNDLPTSTGTAISQINTALQSAGLATRFNVFLLGVATEEMPNPCTSRVSTVTDQIDYVS